MGGGGGGGGGGPSSSASSSSALATRRSAQRQLRLAAIVERTAESTSSRLLQIMFERYKLQEHLHALKRYLMLGQGDFIQHLMDLVGPELQKPAGETYRHTLLSMLDGALRSSNAQYDPPNVLERLDVRLFPSTDGETGWDVFTLDYKLASPQCAVVTASSMQKYLMIFNLLWHLKRVEWSLSSSWKRHMNHNRTLRAVPELAPLLHSCHVLRNEMIHFLTNLQKYMMFEVLETAWNKFKVNS